MTIYKASIEDQIREAEINRLNIKSNVMFQWNFVEEVEKLVDASEVLIREKIIKNYGVEYTEFWNHSFKVKIKDKNIMVEKLIACNFTYKKNDEKFWYIDPQFVVTQKWAKTKIYDVWKFKIWDKKIILENIISQTIDIIEEF